jgi:hypothetical protein
MKANLPSRPIARDHVFIPVTEFTYAAYPIVIKRGFRCLPAATPIPIKPRNQLQSVYKKISP